jgi:hypothetical protein
MFYKAVVQSVLLYGCERGSLLHKYWRYLEGSVTVWHAAYLASVHTF